MDGLIVGTMNNDMEQNFRRRKVILRDAYTTSETPLSEEEEDSLTPLLNELENSATRYNTSELIAEGGEKRIYRVFDQRLNRFVAMAKALKGKTRRDLEQFLREGQLTANLTHPNIVPVYNMGIDSNKNPFFSMELVPGDSLGDIIGKLKTGHPDYKARYALEDMLGIVNKVCDAVAYAHSRKVLHLDIKPENIRVGQFGEVFLCDWGLASVAGHSEEGEPEPGELDSDILNDMTLSGTMKGTPGFMAPEQILNQDKTPQTDIYALGSILYLILTHVLPVDGKTANEVVENTRKGNVIHPRKRGILHPVPSGLAAVAMKALKFKPADRYTSVQAFQADINRHLTGYPTGAEQANLFTRLGLLTQRHRNLTLWILAFFSLLVLVMSINLSIIHREKQISEENFSLYRAEQEETRRINTKLSLFSFHTKDVMSYVSARSMISVAAQLLNQDTLTPEQRRNTLDYKARMHMVLQEFNAAVSTFQRLDTPEIKSPGMLEVCRKYAILKPQDSASLSDADLARFLTTAYEILSRPMAIYTYYHDRLRERPRQPEKYVDVAGAMLARLNSIDSEYIPEMKLTQRAEGYHLDMSHTPYSTYMVDIPAAVSQNVLQPLHLHSLDISHTPISLIRQFGEIKLNEIRMIGVQMEPIGGFVGWLRRIEAKKIILGKDDYSLEVITWIREEGIEVIEEAYTR